MFVGVYGLKLEDGNKEPGKEFLFPHLEVVRDPFSQRLEAAPLKHTEAQALRGQSESPGDSSVSGHGSPKCPDASVTWGSG